MTRVVISQPMLFPWVGFLEQVRLADVYVHLDDAQFSKGSFTNRVQIKTANGIKWLTIPLDGVKLGCQIRDVRAMDDDWRTRHLSLLKHAYAGSPYLDQMLGIVTQCYTNASNSVSEISFRSLQVTWDYFGLRPKLVLTSSDMNVPGSGSDRVLEIVRALGGDTYITGHGALKYLDHELFASHGIRVEYLDYSKIPYEQLHGDFTPFVSSLDLVANCGVRGQSVIQSGTKYWKELV